MALSFDLDSLSKPYNGAELGPMLLLTINRKPYMGGPMTPSPLTLSALERSKSRSLIFQSPIL